jgi:hypothetical protein
MRLNFFVLHDGEDIEKSVQRYVFGPSNQVLLSVRWISDFISFGLGASNT